MLKPTGPAFVVLCLSSLASLTACDIADATRNRMQSGGHSPSMASAEFRYVARQTYGAARSRSCRGASIDYASALSDQILALRNFENQTRSSAAGFHLAVARVDVDLGKTGCWSDNDLRFAERHVQMARETLAQGLEVLPELASSLPDDALQDSLPAGVSAAFRARIVPLVWAVNPMCRLSNEASDTQIMEPATERLAELERQIARTALALHFAIAEADVLYEQSITLVECANPSSEAPELMRAAREDEMKSQIASIEAQFLTNMAVR